ncbi:hypothetical protein HG530_008351 [Fusarium avenaceum]|nr:hypothetical protein HG530_008351 [Fusarium avenaceum]
MVDSDVYDSDGVKEVEVDSGAADVVASGDVDVFESDDKDNSETVNDSVISREVGVVVSELVESDTLEVEASNAEVGIDVANSESTIDTVSEALDSEALVLVFVSVEVTGSEVAAWLDNAVSEADCVLVVLDSAWVDPLPVYLDSIKITKANSTRHEHLIDQNLGRAVCSVDTSQLNSEVGTECRQLHIDFAVISIVHLQDLIEESKDRPGMRNNDVLPDASRTIRIGLSLSPWVTTLREDTQFHTLCFPCITTGVATLGERTSPESMLEAVDVGRVLARSSKVSIDDKIVYDKRSLGCT